MANKMTAQQLIKAIRIVGNDENTINAILAKDVGQGRGNWGHKGRPGMRGGSSKAGSSESQNSGASVDKRITNYLNKPQQIDKIMSGGKVKFGGSVYWANPQTREIYYQNKDDIISGSANGRKFADMDDVFGKQNEEPSNTEKSTGTESTTDPEQSKTSGTMSKQMWGKAYSYIDEARQKMQKNLEKSGVRFYSSIAQNKIDDKIQQLENRIEQDWKDDDVVGQAMMWMDDYDSYVNGGWKKASPEQKSRYIDKARNNPQAGFETMLQYQQNGFDYDDKLSDDQIDDLKAQEDYRENGQQIWQPYERSTNRMWQQ